jgi:hypothetical protein
MKKKCIFYLNFNSAGLLALNKNQHLTLAIIAKAVWQALTHILNGVVMHEKKLYFDLFSWRKLI